MMHSGYGDSEPLGPWTARLESMNRALAERNPHASIGAWRQAYSAALSDPGWRGLLTVASASLRLRALSGSTADAVARARETSWIAFFRARQQRSLEGVLSAAAVFQNVGDHAAFEHSMRVAEMLATRTGQAAGQDRLRDFMERLGNKAGPKDETLGSGVLRVDTPMAAS